MHSVTIAIPTYNRALFLRDALSSAISQTHRAAEIIVIDNNSSDNTKEVVNAFQDKRISYFKNNRNIGMIGNWNKSIQLSSGSHLLILGDDDVLHPDFLKESIKVHSQYDNLGFSFSHCNKVDLDGRYLMKWGYDFPPDGCLSSFDYLWWTVKYGCCLTNSSTVLINKQALKRAGGFKPMFGANTFDFNTWIRIASLYDVYFINQVLANYRLHPNQISEMHWRRQNIPTGKIATYLEILNIFPYLLEHPALDKKKKNYLLRRITEIDKELTKLLTKILPEL